MYGERRASAGAAKIAGPFSWSSAAGYAGEDAWPLPACAIASWRRPFAATISTYGESRKSIEMSPAEQRVALQASASP